MGLNANLITNSENDKFYSELIDSFDGCKKFYFSVAFINSSGLQLLLDKFQDLENLGIEGKIITTTYLHFTDVASIRRLQRFKNIETKIFIAENNRGFHTKGYIFEYEDSFKIYIGSSNITQSALKSNIEWNMKIISKSEDNLAKSVLKEFHYLWNISSDINEEFLQEYNEFLQNNKRNIKKENEAYRKYSEIQPNEMQLLALKNLKQLRESEHNKALVISATGTGKTYLAAFDVKQFDAKRVLFIVHREKILVDAKETFNNVLPESDSCIFNGSNKVYDKKYVFASINTISKNEYLEKFGPVEFDYIIIDEAHRSASGMYQNVLNYFRPKFLLGMTATPERLDNKDIFDNFDNNVAVEIRLREALENGYVVPFHYFGITDVTADYTDIDIEKIDEVAKLLQIKDRVDFVIEKMEFYGFDGEKRKCLGFCVNINHAKYMAEEFNKLGYKSIALIGSDATEEERESAIENLEDNDSDLEFIFTVDIFNEGVDIPTVNLILMLRPTQSAIIFTQQLGRGLRKHEDKEFLTVLDFIGNHNKTFLIPIALNGSRYYDKDALKVIVESDFEDVPGCSNIKLDRIAKENILTQLDIVKFDSMRYLREEYFEFKRMNNDKIPMLSDYLHKPMAPEPVKFINKSKNYLTFLSKTEKTEEFVNLSAGGEMDFINYLSSFLPLRRIYEFYTIWYVLNNGKARYQDIYNLLKRILESVNMKSIYYAFKYISNSVYSKNEQKNKKQFFIFENNEITIGDIPNTIRNGIFKPYVDDILTYGLERYKTDFQDGFYEDTPFKLYEQYSQSDAIILTNTENRSPSSVREGVLNISNDYFLYINLHKDLKKVKESQMYADEFISPSILQWESQSTTSSNSPTGRNLINIGENEYKMHILVRKYQGEKFWYLGRAKPIKHEGQNPIRFQLMLEEALPHYMFNDFTRIVG